MRHHGVRLEAIVLSVFIDIKQDKHLGNFERMIISSTGWILKLWTLSTEGKYLTKI